MLTTDLACRANDCVFSNSKRLTIFFDAATSFFFTSIICSRMFILNYSGLVMWLTLSMLCRFPGCQQLQDTRHRTFYMHLCNEVPWQHSPTQPHSVPRFLHHG